MRVLDVKQGSPEWLAARSQFNTASEAPAMMGASKYLTREQLLRQKATGIVPDVDAHKQALFDRGHETEEAARAIIEEMIGEDLYPITCVSDELGLLASLDGGTMSGKKLMEHKLWSEALAAQVRAQELEPHYYWQLEQELLVAEADVVIFVVSDGTREKMVTMEYRAVPGRREALIAGWKQFDADRAAYVAPVASAVEKIVAEPVEALPAPVVKVSGQLALQDNFQVFEERLRHFLEHKLIREPKTDQDFVDLDAQIAEMRDARKALAAAEAQMLAQVQPIDQAKKTKDMLDKLLQQNVSMAEKILTAEKERRKGEIVAGGVKAFADHVAALNTRLGRAYMPQVAVDFGGCIKNLRSLSSMEDKVAGELARGKIAANAIADKIDLNLKALREHAEEFKFLFADTAALVLKAPDDCLAVIKSRIAEHKAEQARKEDEQRERIRKEEAERVEREHAARVAAEEAERQRAAAEEAKKAEPVAAPVAAPAPAAAPATVVPLRAAAPTPAAAPMSQPTLKLGDISARLAPISLTADGLKSLGFTHAATAGATKLFHERDFPLICAALVRHVEAVQAQQAA